VRDHSTSRKTAMTTGHAAITAKTEDTKTAGARPTTTIRERAAVKTVRFSQRSVEGVCREYSPTVVTTTMTRARLVAHL
jgi:hypothetical protein